MQLVSVTAPVACAACAPCAAVLAETWLEDATEDAAGGFHEGDDAGIGTLELHVMMMLRQRRFAAGALYTTYMYYHTDIVGPDT